MLEVKNESFVFINFNGSRTINAAKALEEYIVLRYPDSKNLIIDTLKYINPVIHKVIVDGYLNIVKKNLKFTEAFTGCLSAGKPEQISQRLSSLLASKIHKLVLDFKPAIIVCTHPFPSDGGSFKEAQKCKGSPVAILTDFVNHPYGFMTTLRPISWDMIILNMTWKNAEFAKIVSFPLGSLFP